MAYVYGTSYAADSLVPRVVYPGDDIIINDTDYMGDGATTFKAGDLIRITTSGQIKNAAADTDTAGAVHGMVLKDYDTAPTTSEPVAIALFDKDTIIRIQVYDVTPGSALPSSCVVGTVHTLNDRGSGHWAVDLATTKGVALVVRQPSIDNAFDPMLGSAIQYGLIDVKIPQSILDGRAA